MADPFDAPPARLDALPSTVLAVIADHVVQLSGGSPRSVIATAAASATLWSQMADPLLAPFWASQCQRMGWSLAWLPPDRPHAAWPYFLIRMRVRWRLRRQLRLGPKIRTMYDGPAVLTAPKVEPYPAGVTWRGGLTGFTLTGPHNAATVVQSDVPSCKAYVTLIDTVLLPFDPAAVAPSNDFGAAAGAAVGAPGCALAPNSLIRGSEVKPGEANIQASIGECCASCQATAGCNAWVYCSQAGGCPAADGSYTRPFGYCQLKSSPEVAAGNAPSYEDTSATSVTVASGYLSRSVTAAGGAGRRLMAEGSTA